MSNNPGSMLRGRKFDYRTILDANDTITIVGANNISYSANVSLLNQYKSYGPRIACFGDSITSRALTDVSPNLYYNAVGYMTWVNNLTKQRFAYLPSYNFGVSGDSTTQMLARIAAVIAIRPNICIVHGGTNDALGNTPATTTIANLNAIYNILAKIGCTIIAVPILGRSGANALTATGRSVAQMVNEYIRRQAYARNNFYVADCGLVFDDPSSTLWTERAGMTTDNLHSEANGAYVIANTITNILNIISPNFLIPASQQIDSYDVTNNIYGNHIGGGGQFVGTAGTVNSPATGQIANGWNTLATSLGGANVTCSKITLSDGRSAQQFLIANTYTGSTKLWQFSYAMNASNISAGDVMEGMMEIQATGNMAGIAGIDIYTQFVENGNTFVNRACSPNQTLTANTFITANLNIILRTPPRIITAIPSSAILVGRAYFINTAGTDPVSCTMNVASATVRKIQN